MKVVALPSIHAYDVTTEDGRTTRLSEEAVMQAKSMRKHH